MNRYPLWKYALLVVVIASGCLYALPNWFGQNPALQITSADSGVPSAREQTRILDILSAEQIAVRGTERTDEHLLLRLASAEAQTRAADELEVRLGRDYTVALNLAPSTPAWLRNLGGQPMYLGLDLRGGVHFLMQVDTQAVLEQTVGRYSDEFRRLLGQAHMRYRHVRTGDG
jgi:preprotein translocase subunit SecD